TPLPRPSTPWSGRPGMRRRIRRAGTSWGFPSRAWAVTNKPSARSTGRSPWKRRRQRSTSGKGTPSNPSNATRRPRTPMVKPPSWTRPPPDSAGPPGPPRILQSRGGGGRAAPRTRRPGYRCAARDGGRPRTARQNRRGDRGARPGGPRGPDGPRDMERERGPLLPIVSPQGGAGGLRPHVEPQPRRPGRARGERTHPPGCRPDSGGPEGLRGRPHPGTRQPGFPRWKGDLPRLRIPFRRCPLPPRGRLPEGPERLRSPPDKGPVSPADGSHGGSYSLFRVRSEGESERRSGPHLDRRG